MAKLYKTVEVKEDVTTLKVCAKCSDCFCGSLHNEEGVEVHEYDGYVPSEFNIGSGDYIEFELDLRSGMILNWKPVEDIHIGA